MKISDRWYLIRMRAYRIWYVAMCTLQQAIRYLKEKVRKK